MRARMRKNLKARVANGSARVFTTMAKNFLAVSKFL